MLKKFVQQGRRRVETGGVPSSTLRISMSRERSWRSFSASVSTIIASGIKNDQFMESGVDKLERSVDNPEIQMEGRDVRDETQSSQWRLPALFMSASAAIADSLLRRAFGWQARRSPPQRTVQVRLGVSRLRLPVSQRDCTISRRTVMSNAGLWIGVIALCFITSGCKP